MTGGYQLGNTIGDPVVGFTFSVAVAKPPIIKIGLDLWRTGLHDGRVVVGAAAQLLGGCGDLQSPAWFILHHVARVYGQPGVTVEYWSCVVPYCVSA